MPYTECALQIQTNKTADLGQCVCSFPSSSHYFKQNRIIQKSHRVVYTFFTDVQEFSYCAVWTNSHIQQRCAIPPTYLSEYARCHQAKKHYKVQIGLLKRSLAICGIDRKSFRYRRFYNFAQHFLRQFRLR